MSLNNQQTPNTSKLANIETIINEGEKIQSEFTAEILKSLLHSIQSKFLTNIKLRNKHGDDYSKYITIEEELNEDLVVLQRIGAYPSWIQTFIMSKGITTFIDILNKHPNNDIVNIVINTIQEITEGDFLNEIEDQKSFIEWFISNNIFETWVRGLQRIDSDTYTEDSNQYKIDIWSVFDNFIEVYPNSCTLMGKTGIIQWLLLTIKALNNDNDSNIINDNLLLFCTEILQELLQAVDENREIFAKLEGIPHWINIISTAKEYNPTNKGHLKNEEYINNIVNCICSSVFDSKNQMIFSKADGINIFIDLMWENTVYRHLSMKILNYALANNKDNSVNFIHSNGLSVLFPYFMEKGIKKRNSKGVEYCLDVIVNLLKYCDGVDLERVLWKFREHKYEKIDKLIRYFIESDTDEINGDEDLQSHYEYVKKTTSVIAWFLCSVKNKENVKEKYSDIARFVERCLRINSVDINTITSVVNEMYSTTDEDKEDDANYCWKGFLGKLLKW